jgi:hypothetical protein
VNATTGNPLAVDDPMSIRINRIWDKETTYAQRKAFIAVTWHNSRAPNDLRLCGEIMKKFEESGHSVLEK